MFNTKLFILLLFFIIIIIITYKLYYNDIHNYGLSNNNNIENFESILYKLKTNNKKNNKNNNNNKNNKNNKNKNNKNNKSITFDELITKSEKFSKEKDNLESITDALTKYKKIFKSNKFKNNSQTTAESFEKFGFYKEKLFDLFK